ncbi:MAG: hypothetical protein ACI825_000919 [Planctomycetota bacterium]|uniref:ATP-dependent zinc protease family protein n=1 Tax=Patiriisocius sp. Uisw_047 TaxID=3230969 RepID=UPI0039ED6BDB
MKRKIGRTDQVDFPLLHLSDIDIKIDTGAYTSSIHCQEMRVEDHLLKCRFLDEEHENYHNKEFVFEKYDVRVVKSSNGQTQVRYRILTEILLYGKIYPIFLTLSDRKEMKFPVLIGRKFLTKRFLVDINRTNLSQKLKQKFLKKKLANDGDI